MKTKASVRNRRRVSRKVRDLVGGPSCCICGAVPIACIIEGHICERCAIDTLPRLLATFACKYTSLCDDSNLVNARVDAMFERFGRKFWKALHHFRTHSANDKLTGQQKPGKVMAS
jgi:hypothetical protein